MFFCNDKSLYKLRNVLLIGSFPLRSKKSCLLKLNVLYLGTNLTSASNLSQICNKLSISRVYQIRYEVDSLNSLEMRQPINSGLLNLLNRYIHISDLQTSCCTFLFNSTTCPSYRCRMFVKKQVEVCFTFVEMLAQFMIQNLAKVLDVLWGQPVKLVQVASTSELHENKQTTFFSFKFYNSQRHFF